MGLNFRKLLISELERRKREIDSVLQVLRYLQQRNYDWDDAPEGGQPPASIYAGLPAPLSLDRQKTILRLREQGLSLRAIAEKVSLSHAGVWKTLQRAQRAPAADPLSMAAVAASGGVPGTAEVRKDLQNCYNGSDSSA
jgi:DNA-binding NarL/FixJ family response regulator